MPLFFDIIIVGLVLSADSFSAALAMGLRKHEFSDSLKFAFSSGSAEAVAVLIGSALGSQIVAYFQSVANWISFTLLAAVSIHMCYEGIKEFIDKKEDNEILKFHSFFKILLVSFATSLDALAVGVSLGVSKKPLIPYVTSIGLFAFLSTIIGMGIAKKATRSFGSVFSLFGSVVLMVLAVQFLN